MKAILLYIMVVTGLIAFQNLQAGAWPTTQFLVRDGHPETDRSMIDQVSLGTLSRAIFSDASGLTPDIAAEIEDYLYKVATYLESNFPAPGLQKTSQIDGLRDQPLAYTLYFYDAGSNAAYAFYTLACSDADAGNIHINSSKFLNNGKVTTKGYSDLAHELFHAVQRTTRVGREKCESGYGDWIVEGQAEAFGHDMARKFRNKSGKSQLTRWGGRQSYIDVLYVKSAQKSNISHDAAYQTSSLWRYLAESWHLRKNSSVTGANKPGPDIAAGYDTDYRYLASLMNTRISGKGEAAEMQWLDNWLRENLWGGLEHIYTDFVAVLADYGLYRIKGKGSVSARYGKWLDTVLSADARKGYPACKSLVLNPQTTTAKASLRLYRIASNCLIVHIDAFSTPKIFDISIVADSESLTRQLHIAMAGGQQLHMAAPIKAIPGSSRYLSTWAVEMDPGKKQVVIVTNVAEKPGNTRFQDIDVEITLAGHDSSEKPVPPPDSGASRPVSEKVKPGPAGADAARKLRRSKMVPETVGKDRASWSYQPKPARCSSNNNWRVNCNANGLVTLMNGLVPSGMRGLSAPVGLDVGAINEMASMMSKMSYAEMGQIINFADDNYGNIEIEVPDIDYGFVGTVTDAVIRVSRGRGKTDLISLGSAPVSLDPPCTYGPPVGVVTIEEFTPTVLRGSYSAAVIEAAFPQRVKRCPATTIVKEVSGTFTIASPLMKDDRTETNYDWYREYISITPVKFNTNMFETLLQNAPQPPPIEMPSSATSGTVKEDEWETSIKDCRCDCDEFRAAMKVSQGLMMGGEPDAGEKRLMTCMGLCISKVADCRL